MEFCELLVSKYTREAGVRTLERRIAAICRAVAVKVLETRSRKKQEKATASNGGKDEVIAGEDVVKSLDSQEAAALSHPPEMPIVIDEAAVEDILGVGVL